jgi:hypothetical protein
LIVSAKDHLYTGGEAEIVGHSPWQGPYHGPGSLHRGELIERHFEIAERLFGPRSSAQVE